ncbi:hypothetical protein DPMN_134351 [Dreissena polymorpha]|uniref:Uncharacterized protein n=1 Tax=Dreissena polymorpha TaxID=45954 RepID=A0A9D4FX80_DREPO|nr:hypothetical protein DPMN_134351 [Dreissena polymorpha]
MTPIPRSDGSCTKNGFEMRPLDLILTTAGQRIILDYGSRTQFSWPLYIGW